MRGWGALSWPPSTTCGPGLGMSRGLLGAKHSGPTTTEGPGFLGTDEGLQMAAGRQQAGGDLPGPLQWVLWGAHGRAPRGSLVRLRLHQACLSGRRTAFVSSGSVLCPLQQAPAYPVCQGLLSGVSHSQSLCSYRFPPSPSSGKNTPVRVELPLTYLGRVLSALCHQQENRGLESWGASPSSQGPRCEAQAGSSRQPSDPIVLGSQYSGRLGGPPSYSGS